MRKQEKIFAVADLKERLKEAKAIILTNYQGLNSAQMNNLRILIKKSGGQLLVVKNTLFKLAATQAGLPSEFTESESLKGPTAILLTHQDDILPIKTVYDFAKSNKLPSFKFGIWEGRILTKEEIERLGSLPSRQEILGKISGILSSPLSFFIQVLTGNPKKLILILKNKGGD